MKPLQSPERALAEAVRQACLEAARASFESASLSGLCREGTVEAAVDAIRALDLGKVLRAPPADGEIP